MMAKLYWRVKRNGKWTWTAAVIDNEDNDCAPEYRWFCIRQEEDE